MQELITGVSWTGVIVGAVASFLWGWLWYSPYMFGKKWADAHGVDIGKASSMPAQAMVVQAIGLFLVSWFVGVTAVSNALATAILALLAFAALYDAGALFAKTPTPGRAINIGYWITAYVLMIISQGIF